MSHPAGPPDDPDVLPDDPESDLDAVQELIKAPDPEAQIPEVLLPQTDLTLPRQKFVKAKSRRRQLAEALYTMTDCSMKELALRPELAGIPRSRLNRWRIQDGWETKRAQVNKAAMLRIHRQMGDNLAERRAESLQRLQNLEDMTYRMLEDTVEPLKAPSFDKAAKVLIETIKAKDDIHEKVVAAVNPDNQPAELKSLDSLSEADLFEMGQVVVGRRLIGKVEPKKPEDSDPEDK